MSIVLFKYVHSTVPAGYKIKKLPNELILIYARLTSLLPINIKKDTPTINGYR